MKHHYPVRALSLLCALAIFVSLIPAVSAAVSQDVLKNHTITDTVTPAGVQLNLFDYWVDKRTSPDNHTEYANVKDSGINEGHYLKFISSGPVSKGDDNINQWTGSSSPKPGIVKDRLSGGYPVLTSDNAYGTNQTTEKTTEQPLAYLFDKSDEGGTYGSTTSYKKTFWDVAGLLRVGKDGYYYYNANQKNVGSNKYESANYAYFDEKTKAFTLYDNWAVQSGGGADIQGQFFPFTDPTTVFELGGNNALTQASISSDSGAIHHYFGMTMTTRFVQRYGGKTSDKHDAGAMTFQFAGDDDVWIFIDGVLVADLGGIHNQATTTIDFSDGDITINDQPAGTLKSKMERYYNDATGYPDYWSGDTFADNTYHTLKLFYLERGGTNSNLAMKFNLAYVPETDGIKVDQNGKLLPGVQFDLYAAERTGNGDGPYTYTKVNPDSSTPDIIEPIGSGTTDEDGRFVLTNADDIAVSLNDLNKRGIQYLILEERNENRTGYRHDDSIYLVLQSNDADTDTVLLNDENHRWTTGTYAALKGSVATSPDITLSDTNETINLDNADGKLFAVIMRRMNNVGQSKPSTADEWGVVTGSALSGWQVTGRESGGSYIPAVIEALQNDAVANGNAVVFTPAANGSYMAELKNCPGDLRNYYYWSNNVDTAYNVAFYYTEESDLSRATEKNTHWVDGAGFERQFAATIYIPNVQHHLYVKKVDDSAAQKPLSGAVFDLYTAESLTVTDGAYGINSNAKPYDTVTTDDDGLATFPSEKKLLAAGNYYLVERTAPAGHTVNPTPVPVIVDDTHGVMADAGTEEDGISVNVSEGTLVPTMTPFATNDAIDHSLTNITTTRMEAPSGSDWNPNLTASTTEKPVELTLDTDKFKLDGSMSYTSHSGRDCWSTETGWLWFHITQTLFNPSEAPLKTDLSRYDLTRLFSGKTTVVVTDTRVGSLAVTKNVEVGDDTSSDRPDPGAAYHVTVTLALDEKPINDAVACEDSAHKLQSVQFENGKAVLSLNAGQTITFPDLPVGTAWTVEETEPLNSNNWETTVTSTGGTVTNKVASGKIKTANQNDTVDITNRYDNYSGWKGTLTGFEVSKSYTSDVYGGSVTFQITGSEGAPMPASTTVSLTKDQIVAKETASFGKLTFNTAGTYIYTIEEVKTPAISGMDYDDAVYTITVSVTRDTTAGELKATITNRTVTRKNETKDLLENEGLTFTNTYTEPKGSLSIKKTVNIVDNSTETPNLGNDAYPIVVTLTNGSSHITGAVTCTDSLDSNHTSVTFGSGGETTLSLKHSQTITLTGLPVGTTWTVREGTLTNAERWDTKYKVNNVDVASASDNISAANEVDSVDITNTYDYAATPTEAEATIKVSKEYAKGKGKTAYTGDVSFTLTRDPSNSADDPLANSSPMTISITGKASKSFETLEFTKAGTYTYTVSEVNGGVNGMTYAETVYTVTFNVARGTGSDRNKLVATPTYTVVEKPGAASNSYPYTDTTGLLFTNTYNPGSSEEQDKGSLSIHKTLENPKNATTGLPKNYEIKITLKNADNTDYTDSVSYTSDAAQHDTLTFKGGEATYRIQAGETLTLSDLPVGTQWTVTETAQLDSTYWRTAYKVNGQDATTVSDDISAANETDAVIITNTYDPNGGEIVPGDTGSLTIYKTVGDGIDAGLSFKFSILLTYQNQTTETRTLTVPANGSVTISDLPVGTLYAVTETTTGYTVTATNATGRIPVGGTTAAFHNALTGGGDVPGPGPGPNPGGDDGGTPALNRRDHYAYIIGYPDGNVHPQGNITRAEVATIFFRLLRDPVRTQYWSQTNSYSDVAGDKWYNNAISTLSNMGIICGYPDGTFRPGAPITRAELTKIAASFFADPRVAREYDGRFSDVKGSEWYIAYLMKAIEEALIYGYPDGTFGPNRPITRAETCAIVNRTLGRKPDKDHLLPESDMINWPDNLRPLAWYYAHMQEATNSHDYSWISIGSEACEQWTAKLAERNWAALERAWSHANSAPGGEVMQ